MINEHKKGFKAKKYASKTKSTEPATVSSPVAKAAQKVAKGSGRHKNPKDAVVQPRLAKHKKAPDLVAEGWSQKYKNSINCSHPKGFSQRAHCAGKKKHDESIEMEMTCPDCGMCEAHGNNMLEVKQRLDAKCWKGKHKEGTKIKSGIRVNNCVPNEGVAEAVPPQAGVVDPKIQFLQPTIQFAERHGYKVTINPNPNGKLFAKLINKQIEHTVRIGFSRGRAPGANLEAEMTDDWDRQTWAWSARELAQDFKEFYRDALRDSPVQGQQGVAEESNTVKKDPKTGKVKSWSHEGDWEKVNSKKDPKGKVHNLTGQALKKTKELNLEEDQMGLGYDLDNLYESKLQMMLDEAVKQTALGKFRSEADKRKQKHDQIAAKQTKDGSGMSSAIDRLEKHVNAKEGFDGGSEYNDEVGMIRNDLHTMVRCAAELNEILKRDENIAEWVQEKIAVAKSMMVTILDYVASEHEMGNIYRK